MACRITGVQCNLTSAYHPQSSGLDEYYFVFPYHSTLVSLLFTPLLPSNSIYHQLSHRKCFNILVSLLFINNWMHMLSKSHDTI